MITEYKTIEKGAEGQFKDRGSKFYAFSYPVSTEDDVKKVLDGLRKEYHDARHHCYAWSLGYDPVKTRANDDGEPSSSAGKPILNQIEKMGLTNILVVVIRYFGGTLLGVGGLINAYRTAAEDCLNKSGIVMKYVQHSYRLEFEYPLMNDVMKVIKDNKLDSEEHVFEMNCSLMIHVRLDQEETVLKQIENIRGLRLETRG